MHLPSPLLLLLLLLLLSSLSPTLAWPLASGSPYSPGHILYHRRNVEPVNVSCPADPVREMEKIVFDYTIEQFESAREAALEASSFGRSSCFNWLSDGCTKAPDKPFGYNFKPSCHRHDFAWNNFRERRAYTKSMKKRFEEQFKEDLMNVCKSKGKVKKAACKCMAKTYVFAVKKYLANKATDPDKP